MSLYRVFIERTEHYTWQDVVEADSPEEARLIVASRDRDNAYEEAWNELQPGVETTYEAELCKEDGNDGL